MKTVSETPELLHGLEKPPSVADCSSRTLTWFLRVVQGVPAGEELALRASSMSRFRRSSFLISWLMDSDQEALSSGDSCRMKKNSSHGGRVGASNGIFTFLIFDTFFPLVGLRYIYCLH